MKKLDKKGFTLTELLAVILIISLLVGLSTTVFISIRNNTLEKDYDNLVKYLETKATEYANKTGITTVSVEDLIKEGVIKADDGNDIYDPRDNSSLNCHIITSTYKDGSYTSNFGKDLGKDNNQCKAYTQTTDFQICKYDGDSCLAEGISNWIKTTDEGITLGVKKGVEVLTDANWTFDWKTTGGATSTDATIKVNANLISEVTVNVEATNPTGLTKGSARTQIKIDNQAPEIIKAETQKGWTKSKSITAEASDLNGSGVYGIYIGTEMSCTSDLKYDKGNKSIKNNLAEGEYIVCAIDKVGNISRLNDSGNGIKNKIRIDKIDDGIDEIALTIDNEGYAIEFILTGTAKDTKSGLVAYKFTTENVEPTSWDNISNTTNEIKETLKVSKNGTYYFWVKDGAGNTRSASYKVEKIGTVKETTISTPELTNSSIIHSASLPGIKSVLSVNVTSGGGTARATNNDISGDNLNISLSGGTNYSGTRSCQKTKAPSVTSASSSETCTSRSCPNGGDLSGTMCIGHDKLENTYNYSVKCNCKNGSTYGCADPPNNNHSCLSGYSKNWRCSSSSGRSCSTEGIGTATVSTGCNMTCTFKSYTAKCNNWKTTYSCSTGTKIGTSCYSCSEGTFDETNKICNYTDTCSYSYYKYTIHITYVV